MPLGDLGPHGLDGLGQLGGPVADAGLQLVSGLLQIGLDLLPLGDVADEARPSGSGRVWIRQTLTLTGIGAPSPLGRKNPSCEWKKLVCWHASRAG